MEYKANDVIQLAGALNVRELGGYVNRDGIRLKEHRVLRGGDLSNLTKEDIEQLKSYGVHTCIDLRIAKEKEMGHPFEKDVQLRYYAIPIAGKVELNNPEEMMYQLYQNILDEHMAELCREFQIIAAAEDAVIFHCTAGKDRTGVTAMLLLDLCNVCEEQIIADYIVSEINNREQIKRQKKQLEESGMRGVPEEIFGSKSETMKKTLAYLVQRYGGAVDYLQKIGITEEEIAAIRGKLLG